MKRFFILVLICIMLAFFLPVSVFYIIKLPKEKTDKKTGEIKVLFTKENVVKDMDVEEYLCGVLAAEMPASFEVEALKAQAVAARSYTYYRAENPTAEHPDAAVCTDFSHCKAYKTIEESQKGWGEKKDFYTKKIENAVYGTSGEIITYNGEAALAVFHSQAGGGKTENSRDVWGGDLPYLVSVESYGEENAPGFYSSASFSYDEFKGLLINQHPDLVLNNFSEIEITEISDGGNVKSIRIGNKSLKGSEVRSIFGLRSSCFKIKTEGNSITFEVAGYGHGVGMSQYGANAMAKDGYSYKDILMHYYTGIKINAV